MPLVRSLLHRITRLSASRTFSLADDREPEIIHVWPFSLR
jgi:hypothetical protein